MDTAEMETSPGYFDAQDLSVRDQYRRYRKRLSSSPASLLHRHSSSKFAETRLLYDGNSIQRRPNAALLLEEIKQEVDSYDAEGFEGAAFRTPSSSKRRTSMDTHAIPEQNVGFASIKQEEEVLSDVGEEATFALFASLLDSALQGLLPFTELILQFKNTCRDVSESIRSESIGRHRIVEDKLMRQKARLLLDEAASWSLLWYLFGKGNLPLAI